MSDLINKVASEQILDQAFQWLCKRREKLSHNNDVWELRRNWQESKSKLQQTLLQGEYTFNPQSELRLPDGNLECWCATDSLVLKAMAIVVGEVLAPHISSRCYHVAGNGGAKKAVGDVHKILSAGDHIMKSDVKSYYASIDHMVIFDQLTEYISDRFVLRLLWQYLKRTVCYRGLYRDVTRGISLGCPLSPLMGALYLKPLDEAMERSGLFYARFMDDWIVIAPTRWKLRKAVKVVNEILAELKVEQHPDKTFIGRVERGFDFLGYSFEPGLLRIAEKTLRNMKERIARLYEQGADAVGIGQYILKWVRWVDAGLKEYVVYMNPLFYFLI